MFDAFAVVLRELAEFALIAGALRAGLEEAGRRDLLGSMRRGLCAGLVAGVAASLCLRRFAAPSSLGGLFAMAFALGVCLLALDRFSSSRSIRLRVQDRFGHGLQGRAAGWLVSGFAGLLAFRECVEIGVLLLEIERADGATVARLGGLLGLLAAACLWIAWRQASARAPLLRLFRWSGLVLALVAVDLLVGGLAETLARASGRDGWLATLVSAVQDGGPGHRWLCAALMLLPVAHFARRWWKEAGEA